MTNRETKYIVASSISSLILQIGAMIFVAIALVYFHQSAQDITSIIGILSVIIGFAFANFAASLVHNYIIKDSRKKDLGQKGNNIASVILVFVVPIALFPYVDFIEENFTQMIFYSVGVSFLLLGILVTFALNWIRI